MSKDVEAMINRFSGFNNWLIQCTNITPYPLSKELYGISSKSYKFQTSMALIIPALYKKIYLEKNVGEIEFEKVIHAIQTALSETFIEKADYTASSTNSKEIKRLVDKFVI